MSDIKKFDKIKVILVAKHSEKDSNRLVISADSNIRVLFRIGGFTKDITPMICSDFAINMTPKTTKIDIKFKTGEVFENIDVEFILDYEYSLWKYKGHEVE